MRKDVEFACDEIWQGILKEDFSFTDYVSFNRPLDNKGRYLPFREFKYRIHNKKVKPELAWQMVKAARESQKQMLFVLGDTDDKIGNYFLTPNILKAISFTDRFATTSYLKYLSHKIGEDKRINYLLDDLVEDEAISSSQLEGAATTTIVAKELLQRKRQPRDINEKMIVGNFLMMQFAWENRKNSLTTELIEEMHKVGTVGIDDDKYYPGAFRNTDDVAVVDGDGEIVHQPPLAKDIEPHLDHIIDFVEHDHDKEAHYIHPLIKAICLHFAIGYIHPFRDGNGRVARCLFYWYMFKNGYGAFRYIAISTLLKKAPVQYGQSYLDTEQDNLDMTYFIDYQCKIIQRAIDTFNETHKNLSEKIRAIDNFVYQSGLYNKLNELQRYIFTNVYNKTIQAESAKNIAEKLGCSRNTAMTALNGLVDLGLFTKIKNGNEYLFFLEDIQKLRNKKNHL